MRKNLLRGVAVSAAVLLAAAVYVVVDGPGGIGGLTGEVAPETRAEQVLAGLKAESPFLAVLEQEQPGVYGALRAALIDDAEAGKAVQRIARTGRQFIADWLDKAVANAPDDIALEILAITTAAMRELAETDPRACNTFAEDGAAGLPAGVSVTLRGRVDDIHMRLAAVPEGTTVVRLPQAEIDAANAAVAPALEARFGDDLNLIAHYVRPEDAARACEIRIATLEAYAGLGAARAAALARSLLAGPDALEAPRTGS